MSRLIRAVIEPSALRHNLSTIRERARRARVMAVVKANGFDELSPAPALGGGAC